MRQLSSGSIVTPFTVVLFFLAANAIAFAQSSPHGSLKQPCVDCHTTTSWKDLAVPMKFNHATTQFPLQGAHINAQCIQCHTTKRFAGTSTDCFSCHKKDFSKATEPNHQRGLLSHDCLNCHTVNSWRPSVFQHAKTNFQLLGAHMSVECSSCHANDRYKGLPGDCFSCHQKEYSATKNPDHTAGRFSRDCRTCHTMNGWVPSTFDHQKTEFQLVGIHVTVECSSCHVQGRTKGIAKDCFGCHQKEFSSVAIPNHTAARFDQNCLTCHTTMSWKPSTFDHAKTEFQLTGAHTTAECSQCHNGGVFQGTPKECYPCHLADLGKIVSPDHIKGQFSQDCLTCHTNIVWTPSIFDHNKTTYPLAGAHAKTECKKCHVNEQYKTLPLDCYGCHQQDFTKVITPNHQTGQFSHDCLTCHTNIVWKPSTFDHKKTNFPLAGAHASVDCASCHGNGIFAGLPSDCFSCHQKDFNATSSPNHSTSQFSHDCITCHSNLSWKPSTFNHNTTTFPLVGAHVSVTCASCHTNGQFKGLPSDCFSCHQNDFTGTTNPNHTTSQFSHDCLTCHSNAAWKPSTFNHSNTNFPLLGSHAAVACLDCHKNGLYAGTSADCFSCHQSDFNGVTDPNHVSNTFDHNCLSCHSMNGWKPATFDHNKTSFPLTGAHVSANCASCHAGGKYTGTSTDCYSCHQSDYTSATNPAHATAGYPKTCITCHTTSAWVPSTFNHTPFFPIRSGDVHRPGRWSTCADCHTNSTNFSVFSCITCHEHNKTTMDNKHQGRSGYSYDSNACYRCHPTGRN